MRNVLLSLVVVAALIAGGIGGTLATWSDSETSEGNYIKTGSVDLKVNGNDDEPWGSGVGAVIQASNVTPCKWQGPYEVVLWNAGQHEGNASAFIHVRNITCWNIDPKLRPDGTSSGYEDPDTGIGDYVPSPSLLKPEPELVAEYGGWVSNVLVPGIGPEGDDCSLGSNTLMAITDNDTAPVTPNSPNVLHWDEIGKWECLEIYLLELEPCVPQTIYVWFKLLQRPEEDPLYGGNMDYINPDPWDPDFPAVGTPGYAEAMLYWTKFNDWPSWALMKDMITFDIEFDLWLVHADDLPLINNTDG